jgi:type IV pilus assembly protein PilX
MKQSINISSPHRQRGAVLVVSLLMLLVITILALGAGQSTRLQERMVSSQRDYDLALQSAEAGLRAGERRVDSFTAAPLSCLTLNDTVCQVYELGALNSSVTYEDQAFQPDEWWTANAIPYDEGASDVMSGDGLSRADPDYYIEEVEEVRDTLSIPPTGAPPSRIFYRVVARGKGGSENAQSVLHSTIVRRF